MRALPVVPGVWGDNLAVGQVVDLLSYLGPVLAAAKLEREGQVHTDGEESAKTSYQAVVNDDGPLPLHVLPPVLQARVGQLEGLQLGGAAPRGGGGCVGGGGGEVVGGRGGRRRGGGGGCSPGGQSRQRSAKGMHRGGGHIRSSAKVKQLDKRRVQRLAGYSRTGARRAEGAGAGREATLPPQPLLGGCGEIEMFDVFIM